LRNNQISGDQTDGDQADDNWIDIRTMVCRSMLGGAIALCTATSLTSSIAKAEVTTADPEASAVFSSVKSEVNVIANQPERILIPGTSLSLRPPANFVLSDQFSGLVNIDTFSSIVLTELPREAYSELAETFSLSPSEITTLFSARGFDLEVENVSSLSIQDAQVPFVSGVQTLSGTQVQKYLVLLGEDSTILLTFNIVGQDSLSEQAVIETIQSVEIGSVPSVAQKIAELPFTFAAAEPFEVFDVLLGSSVVLTAEGESDFTGEAPLVIIATSLNPVRTADIAEYSAYLLNSTSGFEDAVITEQSPVDFAGEDGYFVRANSQEGIVLQYLSIQPDNSYIRMVVTGEQEAIEELLPAIETIQRSVAANPKELNQ